MKAKLLLIAMLYLLIGSKSKAQEATGKKTTISATRQFALILRNGESITEQSVSVQCSYIVETKEYTIGIDPPKIAGLKQNGPLSYDAFGLAFTDSFNKGKSASEKVVIEQQSLQAIFIWLYRLATNDNDDVKSGDLVFNSYIKVCNKDRTPKNTIDNGISDFIKNELITKQQDRRTNRDAMLSFLKVDSASFLLSSDKKSEIKNLKFYSAFSFDKKDSLKSDSIRLQQKLSYIRTIIDTNKYSKINGKEKFGLTIDDADTTEIQKLIDKFNASIDSLNSFSAALRRDRIYKIKKVTIKFERGFIEEVNIGLDIGYNQIELYEAFIPIGFSSKSDMKNLYQMKLYPRDPFLQNNFIYLSDVIARYDVFQDLYTRDYSPADTLINGLDPENHPIVTLKKERLVRLFDTRIYTDLSGIESNTPNGLIQTEVSRRFNLVTKRFQLLGKKDMGYFNYFNIFGGLSKIENKLKRLPLENNYTIRNGSLQSPNYVTNLDLRRYENFSIGIETNLITFNINTAKLIVTLDIGARYGHIPILDSTYSYNKLTGTLTPPSLSQNVYTDGHTLNYYPKLSFEYLPQRRVGLTFSMCYFFTNLRGNNEFKAVMSKTKSDLDNPFIERLSKQSYMAELFARVNTSPDGDNQIFFRTRLFWQCGDRNTFFPQIQLGYNYNLFFKGS